MVAESLWAAWSFQPLVLGLGIVAVAFFLHGWLRLRRRRPELAPWTRIPLFVAGVLVNVLAIVSPVDRIGEHYLQWAHMLQHVLLADLGVVLILLAVRGPLTVFFVPRDLLAPLARARPLRRTLGLLLRPGVSYAVWVVVLVGWHIPLLYEAALHHRVWHDVEHLSFVLGGILVWTQIIDPGRHHRLTLGERLGYTALVFWTSQVMAYVILFSFEPLYSTYVDQPDRLLGLSPLGDQRLAGLVMMVEQTLTVGVAFVLLLRSSRRRQLADTSRAPQPA
jgi:putative membrane protein